MKNEQSKLDAGNGAVRLLTYRQASAYLGLSERKLWALAASAEIPQVRIGRSVRFDANDLNRFVEKMKTS